MTLRRQSNRSRKGQVQPGRPIADEMARSVRTTVSQLPDYLCGRVWISVTKIRLNSKILLPLHLTKF